MSQTLVKNHVHIVFSTKDRLPFLDHGIAPSVHRYISGICNNQQCYPGLIGGDIEHIHILCQLSKNIALSTFLQELKTSSSKWIKMQNKGLSTFKWQTGYSSFSVSNNQLEAVTQYIANQRTHHLRVSYQDELRSLLRDNNIPFDEKYLWD